MHAPPLPPLRDGRLLDQVRERASEVHFSLATEEAYVYWCYALVHLHGLRHPAEMASPEVEAFLWVKDLALSAESGLKDAALLRTLFDRIGWHRASGYRPQKSCGRHKGRLRGGT